MADRQFARKRTAPEREVDRAAQPFLLEGELSERAGCELVEETSQGFPFFRVPIAQCREQARPKRQVVGESPAGDAIVSARGSRGRAYPPASDYEETNGRTVRRIRHGSARHRREGPQMGRGPRGQILHGSNVACRTCRGSTGNDRSPSRCSRTESLKIHSNLTKQKPFACPHRSRASAQAGLISLLRPGRHWGLRPTLAPRVRARQVIPGLQALMSDAAVF